MPLALASTTTVVASIPALIGFMPHDSLVLITTLRNDDGSVTTGPLTRIDLAHLTRHADDCVRQFNRQCADLPVLCVTGILVRTVDEDAASDASLPLRADVDTVVELLTEYGFTDVDVVHVPAVAQDARWRSYLHADRTGVLPDPATTPAAAAAVVAGHAIAARREDLVARFTPAPEHLRERLQGRIAAAVAELGIDEQRPAAAAARITRAEAAIRAACPAFCPPTTPRSSISPRPSLCPRSVTPCSPSPTTRRAWLPRTWHCTCGVTAASPSPASSRPSSPCTPTCEATEPARGPRSRTPTLSSP